jgi:predicted RNase H-like HicB family nuclease
MHIRTIKVLVRIVVERDEDSFYAYCPELKGLHVGGDTEQEAVENARNAASAYLMSLIKHNDPLPVGSQDASVNFGDFVKQIAGSILGKHHTRIEELSLAT